MNPEILSTSEKLKPSTQETVTPPGVLDEQQIDSVMLSRKALLESIKPEITLKSYYAMEEKILNEEKRLKDILDFKRGRQHRLAKYSFILNSNYFEQEFLS